jgi:hypothetical protein
MPSSPPTCSSSVLSIVAVKVVPGRGGAGRRGSGLGCGRLAREPAPRFGNTGSSDWLSYRFTWAPAWWLLGEITEPASPSGAVDLVMTSARPRVRLGSSSRSG